MATAVISPHLQTAFKTRFSGSQSARNSSETIVNDYCLSDTLRVTAKKCRELFFGSVSRFILRKRFPTRVQSRFNHSSVFADMPMWSEDTRPGVERMVREIRSLGFAFAFLLKSASVKGCHKRVDLFYIFILGSRGSNKNNE